MFQLHGLLLLILDAAVLGYLILSPLSRRFDDSDQGAGSIVRLPPFRRPSVPRVTSFFLLITVVNTYVALLKGAPLAKDYRAMVAGVLRTLVADPAQASYYASKLVPLVPATMVSFMAIMAIVLPGTLGRRLMIAAHGLLFLAVSVISTCFLAVAAISLRASFGPLPLIDVLLQESLAYLVVFRFAFTSFQYPRVTQVPSLGRGRWQAHLIMILCLAGAIGLTAILAAGLVPLAGGQLLISFLIIRSLRAGILDWLYVLLGLVRLGGPRPPKPGSERPPLEVIIPAFNESVVIERTLRSIDRAAGRYGGSVRVILCDDGSTDGTRDLAEATMAEFRFAAGEVIQGRHAGKAIALNLALAQCTADYVYRIDADCALDPNAFVYSISQFLAYPDVGLVGAFVMPKEPHGTWIDRMRALEMIFSFGFARVMLAEVDAVPCIPGTFCAFRRLLALEVGGFIDGTLGEDVFFTCELARLGYRAAVDPRVISYEDVPTSLRQLRVQRFRWSKGGIMSFAAFTPFGACGAPSPRNWFKMPMGAGKGLLKPFGTTMMLLTLEYSILDPAVQHSVVRFLVLLVATQLPAIIPRLIVMAYYRRLSLLPWMVTWFPFSLLKRLFVIEAVLSFGMRPVKPPLALRARYPTWRSLLLAVVAIATVGCSAGTTSGHPAPAERLAPAASSTATWIFTKQALDAVTANPSARARLDGAHVYEILKDKQQPSTAVPVLPTVSFKSFAALAGTLDRGRLPRDTRAVIYDAEHWAQTPVDEQRDPASFYRQAAAITHRHGLIFIATPAMDLVNTDAKIADQAASFLKENIDASAASGADVLDIQAQSLERDPAAYQDFVGKAAAQARSANPKVTVVAGLSTNPPGSPVTPTMLVSDITAVAATTSGFWMNIPDLGPDCTDCTRSRPEVAVGALTDRRLAALSTLFTH